MSNEFDLEKAKAGEPVEYLGLGDRWEPCRFLGTSESGDGYLVVERINGNGFQISYASPTDLRMAAKKVTVRYRDAVMANSASVRYVTSCTDGVGLTPVDFEVCGNFVEWIHDDWQEVEVPNEN